MEINVSELKVDLEKKREANSEWLKSDANKLWNNEILVSFFM